MIEQLNELLTPKLVGRARVLFVPGFADVSFSVSDVFE